jgi:hypothetical protein
MMSEMGMFRQLTHNRVEPWPPAKVLGFQRMWPWTRRKTIPEGFPGGAPFSISASVQRLQFRSNPLPTSQNIFVNVPRLPVHCWLNRMTSDIHLRPSWRRKEMDSGWIATYHCVREFSTLADAATDYLPFSLGKGRWTPQK